MSTANEKYFCTLHLLVFLFQKSKGKMRGMIYMLLLKRKKVHSWCSLSQIQMSCYIHTSGTQAFQVLYMILISPQCSLLVINFEHKSSQLTRMIKECFFMLNNCNCLTTRSSIDVRHPGLLTAVSSSLLAWLLFMGPVITGQCCMRFLKWLLN